MKTDVSPKAHPSINKSSQKEAVLQIRKCLFQADHMGWAASWQLSVNVSQQSLAKERPSEYGRFQGLHEATEFLTFLTKLSCKMECFVFKNIVSLYELHEECNVSPSLE